MLYGKNGEKLYNPTFCFTDTIHGIKVKLSVLADDGANPPCTVHDEIIVAPEVLSVCGISIYGPACTELMQKIMDADLTPPDKCECQSREWLEAHPDDIQGILAHARRADLCQGSHKSLPEEPKEQEQK